MAEQDKSSTQIRFCFHPRDALALSKRLKEYYPEIRFLDGAAKLPKNTPWHFETQLYGTPDPERYGLPYISSLGTAKSYTMRAWLEPPGWRPIWAGPDENKVYRLVNMPRIQFVFKGNLSPTKNSYPGWMTFESDALGRSFPLTTWHLSCDQTISADFDKSDKEHKSFLRRVWRIIKDELTTQNMLAIDVLQSKPSVPYEKNKDLSRFRMFDRFGFHAVAWVRKNSHRFLGPFYRPADEFYDWHSGKLKLRYPKTKLPGPAVESHLPSEYGCGKLKFIVNKGTGKIYVREPDWGMIVPLERSLKNNAKPIRD